MSCFVAVLASQCVLQLRPQLLTRPCVCVPLAVRSDPDNGWEKSVTLLLIVAATAACQLAAHCYHRSNGDRSGSAGGRYASLIVACNLSESARPNATPAREAQPQLITETISEASPSTNGLGMFWIGRGGVAAGLGRGPIPLAEVAASGSLQGQRWGDVVGSEGSATAAAAASRGPHAQEAPAREAAKEEQQQQEQPGVADDPKFSIADGDGDDYEEF